MENTSSVISFQMVFFYLVTTGWIFEIISLRENSINQSIRAVVGEPAAGIYIYIQRKIMTRLDLLSIPQSGGRK